ncbi:unnamed protein product [Thelazia callipaeda]|uniref:Uncharacterized protein n=1 Tax=Thelazia callipaeda TaxID=103827 RepID=A0A0N5CLT3_THECL|nr:unnamed protein product [Thelazia callipaeda]
MLKAPFLTHSLRQSNNTLEHACVLFIGLGARTIANYIHRFHQVETNELILEESSWYLSKIWFVNPTWNRINFSTAGKRIIIA